MWDVQTAVQAVAVVAVASLLVPPLARGIGGICAVIGFCGVVQSSSWAPTVMALGLVAWFVGHWSFAVRIDVHYRSRLARVVIDRTLLRWTIPRYWQLRRQRRMAAARWGVSPVAWWGFGAGILADEGVAVRCRGRAIA